MDDEYSSLDERLINGKGEQVEALCGVSFFDSHNHEIASFFRLYLRHLTSLFSSLRYLTYSSL